MKRNLLGAIIFTLLLLPTAALTQDRFASVEIKATKVRGSVYMLTGAGGNIGVSVGDDGILIVDDQYAPLAGKIRAALKELSNGKLRYILNTHWHGDHTGGNLEFGKEASVIAHHNVRKRMAAGQELLGRTVEPAEHGSLPVITFGDSLTIHFNEEIRTVHFPHGHTDGDSVVFFTESNVVHMGDDMFAGQFPFVDLSSGGSVQGVTKNIGKLLEEIPDDALLIPGHGALSTPEDLETYHRMLTESLDGVRKQMKSGKSLEEIQANGVAEEWTEWGGGFISTDKWIETVYQSLSQN